MKSLIIKNSEIKKSQYKQIKEIVQKYIKKDSKDYSVLMQLINNIIK